jgi:hypothetical protein
MRGLPTVEASLPEFSRFNIQNRQGLLVLRSAQLNLHFTCASAKRLLYSNPGHVARAREGLCSIPTHWEPYHGTEESH